MLPWFTPVLLTALILILKHRKSSSEAKNRPPGPPDWPIFGNIFHLGEFPHPRLYKLRSKYGPVIWLRLGYVKTLVIQSAITAERLFKDHDVQFSDRKGSDAFTAHNYYQGSLSLGRYCPSWRVLRRIVTLELMTRKKIIESVSVRRRCIDQMIGSIQEDAAAAAAHARGESGEVVVSRYVFVMAFNLLGNLLLSRDLLNCHSKEGTEFFQAMDMVMKWGKKPNLSDFLPFLKGFDPKRIRKNMEGDLGRAMNIVGKYVMERIEDRKLMKERERKDFLVAILEYDGPDQISTHNRLILILEMFFGGTETISVRAEWVIAALFRSPESMASVKEELHQVVGARSKVEESDIDGLPYLQGVIKETLRLHPVVPLLVPRNTLEDTKFMGYLIPKDTQVFINAWAIGRDHDAWEDPLSFRPERFLGSDIDYRGQHFELLPFGSGRRICVGVPLAHRVIHLTVGSLLHCFDWELDSNSAADAIDMKERMGLTVRKLIPLKAIPKKTTAE